jgi:hypothetical protein
VNTHELLSAAVEIGNLMGSTGCNFQCDQYCEAAISTSDFVKPVNVNSLEPT